MTPFDRRTFLLGAGAAPLAFGLGGAWVPRGDDRCLLVLELVGGNDGLNTVIPVDDEGYGKRRPVLGEVRKGAHRLADGTALHPTLARLHETVGDGLATVVHGVGYPDPDRSHFRSRDIWHVADPAHVRVSATTTGWLGRAADALRQQVDVPAAAVGSLQVPLLMKAREATVPSVRRVEDFQWLAAANRGAMARDAATRDVVTGLDDRGSDLRRFVASRARHAVEMADGLSAALASYRPAAQYPGSALGRNLQLVAQLICTGFGTRLLHVPFGGFDTHARQLPTHAGLLRQLDAALGAFVSDLRAHGRLEQVCTLVHSEFGRRVAENASQGTDHGAAGPAFVIGGGTRGGVLGEAPDLGRLDDGDVVATMDFRRLYADMLAWVGIEARPVLGGEFASAALFRG
jgi:uncharacterized protein (DUF1501 family)